MKKTNSNPNDAIAMVLEIHDQVTNASARRMQEADLMVATTSKEEKEEFEIMEKMAAIGFGNVKEVKQSGAAVKERKLNFERSKLILDYQMRYPDFKFITTEDLEAICSKYNLILGADKQYIGSIPMRSMKRIVNFVLRPEDRIYMKGTLKAFEQTINSGERTKTTQNTIEWKEINEATFNSETHNGTSLIQNGNRAHYICNDQYFTIGAPASMFNIEGMKIEGNELKKVVTITESWDPFCLKTVKYGYLILALWGEELAIEQMNNEKHN